ncbi:MAG: HAD-IIIA family hydrolase [Thaumarchaeota archaeon]|nr:HAD-IIIA family hydrolase [Nitrososphaerota archaeon]
MDRDGVLNELVYDKEGGRVASPVSAKQLVVSTYAPDAVEKIRNLGFKSIVISNQPGVAKKQFTLRELSRMNEKIRSELRDEGASIDAEYYCLHHPNALIKRYRVNCDCRKPKPGLLLKAAKECQLDLKNSYFVGDSLIDVKAGKAAGCKTILIATMTDLLNRVISTEKAEPDYLVRNLSEVPNLLSDLAKG